MQANCIGILTILGTSRIYILLVVSWLATWYQKLTDQVGRHEDDRASQGEVQRIPPILRAFCWVNLYYVVLRASLLLLLKTVSSLSACLCHCVKHG